MSSTTLSGGYAVGAGSRARTRAAAASTRSAPARRRSPVRLTRRGRLLVVLVTLFVLVIGFSLGTVASQAAGNSAPVKPPTVTVQPGETLWHLAGRIAPHSDPRLVVAQIEQLNRLAGPDLVAGQLLVVPRAH